MATVKSSLLFNSLPGIRLIYPPTPNLPELPIVIIKSGHPEFMSLLLTVVMAISGRTRYLLSSLAPRTISRGALLRLWFSLATTQQAAVASFMHCRPLPTRLPFYPAPLSLPLSPPLRLLQLSQLGTGLV